MKTFLKVSLGVFCLVLVAFSQAPADTSNYKCLIQLTNYEGEGAYVVVSILDADNNYLETLYVQGDDEEWYRDIEEWWKNLGNH